MEPYILILDTIDGVATWYQVRMRVENGVTNGT